MNSKLFGDKNFYAKLLKLSIPIMIQNGITNFVNMLDNVMVGRIGTVEMTGVSVTNQLLMVFNLCIFGCVSGAGIFGAQFFGKRDHKGLRDTFRFKLISCTIITVLAIALFLVWGNPLIKLYLSGEGSAEDINASLGFSRSYLLVMLIGLLPMSIVQSYSSSLRETGETKLPMFASTIAVLVNLALNYILIFGHFGFPELGVIGAAIATVISRFTELFIIVIWCKNHQSEHTLFLEDALKSFKVPLKLTRQIISKGLPLVINETAWGAGCAMLTQCYSVRGLNVVGAANIASTFQNLFAVAFIALGASAGIILGQYLGAGETEKAKTDCIKLITFSVFVSFVIGIVYFFCADFISDFYNTTDDIKYIATNMMKICAISLPIDACANACYFTLRSGGKAFVTFLFDSCFMWVVNVPVAFVLSRFSDIPILPLYAICVFISLIKCFIGIGFIYQGSWAKNIVSQ